MRSNWILWSVVALVALAIPAQAQWTLLEELDVNSINSTGTTSTAVLEAGKQYQFEVSGTYFAAGSGTTWECDAEYLNQPGQGWIDTLIWPSQPAWEVDDNFEVWVNGAGVEWGATLDPNHIYTLDFTGLDAPVHFFINEISGSYADNGGSLHIRIFEQQTAPFGSTHEYKRLTADSILLSGCLIDNGTLASECRYHYWAEGGDTVTTEWKSIRFVDYTPISNLIPNTIYSYVLEVRNSMGSYVSYPKSFLTQSRIAISSTEGGSVVDPVEESIVADGGTVIDINAVADEGFAFVGWSGSAVDAGLVADPEAAVTTVEITGDLTLVANFLPLYTLDVSSSDCGVVTYPGEGSYIIISGTVIDIVAVADDRCQFIGWTGTAVDAGMVADPEAASTTLEITGDATLVANFLPVWALDISSTDDGYVSYPGEGIYDILDGTVIDIIAIAEETGTFAGWTGTAVDAGLVADPYAASTTVEVVGSDLTLVAEFDAKPYIIWVDDNLKYNFDTNEPSSIGFVQLLRDQGYYVDFKGEYMPHEPGNDDNALNPDWLYWRELDPNKIAELEAADLIIIGRVVSSGTYDDANEAEMWNAISTPMISQSAHVCRAYSKWGWFNTTGTSNKTPRLMLSTYDDHDIFAGVAIDPNGNVDLVDPNAQVTLPNLNEGTVAGNGTLLGVHDEGYPWIVTWEPGIEYYDGSGQIPAGPRMFLGVAAGKTMNDLVEGGYNLTADGQTLFLNAVEYMMAGAPIVQNASFELPGTEKLQNWESVPAWSSDTLPVDSGVEQGWGATDGIWTGFLKAADPSVWQTTGHILAIGDVLTLSVNAKNNWLGTTVELTLYVEDANGVRLPLAIADANFTDDMATYSVTATACDTPDLMGLPVGVEINHVTAEGGSWMGFDEVSLTVENEGLVIDGLTHRYTFEDGTATDLVGGVDGVLYYDANIVDGLLVLDGTDDYMDINGPAVDVNSYEELTIVLWCAQTVDNSWTMTSSMGGTWDNGLGKNYVNVTSARGDQMNRGAIAITPDNDQPWLDEVGVSSPEMNDGIMHHYVLTINATDLTYYVDGMLAGTAEMGTASLSGLDNDYIYLGKGIYSVDGQWAGSIDSFSLYNKALTENEVKCLYIVGE